MPKKTPPFVFQPRDVEILKAIYDHRFLTRALILPLFDVEAAAEDTNLDRRLRKLTAAGYVSRLPRQDRRIEYVYALTGAGAEILKKHQLPLPFADWSEKNRVKADFVAHTLMVARWYVSIVTGLKEMPAVKIECYERESRPRGQRALLRSWVNQRGTPRKVNPDALLILAGDGIHPGAHFLEADQSTMGLDYRMTDKFEDYAVMYREKRHPEFFSVPSFRVCVIAKSEQRASNLLNLLIDGTDIRPEERRLFWFTTEETYRNTPANVMASVWRSADDPHSLRALVGSPLPRRSKSENEKTPAVTEGLQDRQSKELFPTLE